PLSRRRLRDADGARACRSRQEQCRGQRPGDGPGPGHRAERRRLPRLQPRPAGHRHRPVAAADPAHVGRRQERHQEEAGAMKMNILFPALAVLMLSQVPQAHAQAISLGNGASTGNQPIEIIARDGIEWNRDKQQYIARGDARATQNGTTVEADVLTAYYRQGASSRTEIFRYQAEGNVRIYTPTHRAVGDRAVFDIDTGVLVLTGNGLKLTTPNEVVTARDALEYWDRRQIAVARGNALVQTQDG